VYSKGIYVCVVQVPFSAGLIKIEPTHLAICHVVMGEDKELEGQQAALGKVKESRYWCVRVGSREGFNYNLRPKIYIKYSSRLCRVVRIHIHGTGVLSL